MLKKAIFNTASSATLKIFGFIYSLVIVGLASRQISTDHTAQLLLAFNYLVPLGLVQAGMGSLVLRKAIKNYVESGSIAGTIEIGVCFQITIFASSLISLVVLTIFPIIEMKFLIPTIVIMLIGFICSTADNIWIATERGWVPNLCLAVSFLILSASFFIAQEFGYMTIVVLAVITYSAPSIASTLSFILRIRDPIYRSLLLQVNGNIFKVLREAFPMLLTSIATSLLIALPTMSTFWHKMPHLDNIEIPLMRLSTIAVNASVVMLFPFLPVLVRILSHGDQSRKIGFQKIFITVIVGVTIITIPFLYFILPIFVRLWIGLDIEQFNILLPWTLIMACWIGAAISGQIALMTCSPLRVAAIVGLCDLAVIIFMVAGAFGAPMTVAISLLIGIILQMFLALKLIYQQS